MPRHLVRSAVAVMASAALIVSASPSYAGTRTFKDTIGDTSNSGLLDIGEVTVKNTAKYVSVKFEFPPNDYTPGPDGRFEVLLDTTTRTAGAELSWSAPLFSEFSVVPVRKGKKLHRENWLRPTSKPPKCANTVRIDWNPQRGYGRLKLFKKKGCVGKPSNVRVRVKTVVTGEHTEFEGIAYPRSEIDYYPAATRFSRWVHQ